MTRETDPDGFHQRLSEFIRENLFHVGISNPFSPIRQVALYRQQAENAIRIGQNVHPSFWRYDFSDYVTEYTFRQCVAQYPAADLCPKNLRAILQYDASHPGNELTETLYYYYICNFNAQKAAQRLFIHRTTFFYRMNKIQKLATFHADDPKEKCQILLAVLLLHGTDEKKEP